ncbi:MAG: DUF1501 domain-containing protein [Planctomycetaceae bacterium]
MAACSQFLEPICRRDWLARTAGGFGSLALAQLLAKDGHLLADDQPKPEFQDGLHHPAKVRRVIQLFMNGGASQMDTFDYKPVLEKRHGEKVDFGIKSAATSVPGAIMKSPFEWKQHGESGAGGSRASSRTSPVASTISLF